ncbi:hypothetical protein ACFXPT_37860 [Streptomyces goshikiensis]|uniref:hypothetical protein n=1 Tax=Streptomyces goshikiensis TaxID=1942 RepID=UPI0036987FA8
MVGVLESAEPDLARGPGDHVAHDVNQPGTLGDDVVDEAREEFFKGVDAAAPEQVRMTGLRHPLSALGAFGQGIPLDDGDVCELGED